MSAAIDDDGDPITSCVVVPDDAAKSAAIKLTEQQQHFVEILYQSIAECPATPIELQGTATVPNGVTAVTRDVLKKYCVARGWFDDDQDNRRRAKLSKMLNTLAAKKRVGLTDRFVWIIP